MDSMRLVNEIQGFLDGLIGKSENTKILYRTALKEFLEYAEAKKKLDPIGFLNTLEGRGLAKNTVRVYAVVLKAFFKSIKRLDITEKIPNVRQAETIPVPLAGENLEKMMAVASPRNRLVLSLFISTGMRLSELLGINVEDIDFAESTIRIRGKGDRVRIILTDQRTLQLLKEYLQGRTSGRVIDLSPSMVRHIFKEMARKAGLPNWEKMHPHLARHTFCINWVKAGGDIESLRRLTGHRSLESVKWYLNFSFSDVKDVYRRVRGETLV